MEQAISIHQVAVAINLLGLIVSVFVFVKRYREGERGWTVFTVFAMGLICMINLYSSVQFLSAF